MVNIRKENEMKKKMFNLTGYKQNREDVIEPDDEDAERIKMLLEKGDCMFSVKRLARMVLCYKTSVALVENPSVLLIKALKQCKFTIVEMKGGEYEY